MVTCGLWAIVWFFQLGADIQELRGDEEPNVLRDFLLSFITCGLWSLYVAYQWPVLIVEPLVKREVHVDKNLPVISLVMSLFGVQIVGLVLMQSAVNKGLQELQQGRLRR